MSKKYNYFKNEDGKYECGYCGKSYKYKSGARRHIRKNHSDERLKQKQREKIEVNEEGNE